MNSLTMTSLNPTVVLPKIGTLIPNRIFVGGITSTTTEDDLRNFFGSFGSIKDVKVIYDRSGLSKGNYGFVTFEHQETAEMIIKNEAESLMFKDRKINIGYAVRKQPIFQRQDGNGQLLFTNTTIPCQMQNGFSFIPFSSQSCPIAPSNSQALRPQTIMLPPSANSTAMYNASVSSVNGLNRIPVSNGNNLVSDEGRKNYNRHILYDHSNTNTMATGGSIIPSGTLLYIHSPVMIPNGTGNQSIEIIYPQNAVCIGSNRSIPSCNADNKPIPLTFLTDYNHNHDTRLPNRSIQTIHSFQQVPIKETNPIFSHQDHQSQPMDAAGHLRSTFTDSFPEAAQRPPFLQISPPSQQPSCFNQSQNSELFARSCKPARSSMDLSEMFNATYSQELLHNGAQQRVQTTARKINEPNHELTGSLQTQQPAQCCNKTTLGSSPWFNRVMLSSLEESTDDGLNIEGNIWHPDHQLKRSDSVSTMFDPRGLSTSETNETQNHQSSSPWLPRDSEIQKVPNECCSRTPTAGEFQQEEFRCSLLNGRLSQRPSPNENTQNEYQFSESNNQGKLSASHHLESIPNLFTPTRWAQKTLYNINHTEGVSQLFSSLGAINNTHRNPATLMQSHAGNFLRNIQSPNARRLPIDEEKFSYLQNASSSISSPLNGATASGDTTRRNF